MVKNRSKKFRKLSFLTDLDSSDISEKNVYVQIARTKHPPDFHTSNESLSYNLPISVHELQSTILRNLKNASPGPDRIHASMIQNLHPNSFTYLLDLFNSILSKNTYPHSWKMAITLPILKPNKDPTLPSSYRPIALTSVLGKLFQKILSKRLFWYLESNYILSPHQYGFRKGRNTLHALSDLQYQILSAFYSKSYLFSIFFDLQEAFPRVWRHHICSQLHDIGLRGNLPKTLQNFLNDRTLSVRIQDHLSSTYIIEIGVPQGEVLSVPLFLLAINDLTKCTKFPLTQRLFADDYCISLSSPNPHRAHRLLQDTLNKISTWTSNHGFRFSPTKTHIVIFQKSKRKIPYLPPLHLQNFQIKYQDSATFLGLLFDQRMSWTPHIKLLRSKCLSSINIMKYLSHPRTGCNRKILLQLYKSLIRSKLDYGSPIYNQACKSSLTLLDSIQASSLRLALGAFRSSPKLSLCAEAGEPPLHFRRHILTANFLASSAQFPQLPIYNTILSPPHPHFSVIPPDKLLLTTVEQHLKKTPRLTPLQTIIPSKPPWLFVPPEIRFDLTKIPSKNTSILRKHIRLIISEHSNFTPCYTDGSKAGQKAGYAFSIQGKVHSRRLRNSSSIFSAELNAILSCLSCLTLLPPSSNFLLLTDSLSSLHAISDPESPNPLVQLIQITLSSLTSIKSTVVFVWVPGHIDLPEHDAVDLAAKNTLSFPKITDPRSPTASDLKTYYRSHILNSWLLLWQNQSSNKLLNIKTKPIPWKTSLLKSRQQETLLARLRIGHTRLTHSFLFLGLIEPATCPYCLQYTLSVEHFFSCPDLQPLRNFHKTPSSPTAALSDNPETIAHTLSFLKSLTFFSLL